VKPHLSYPVARVLVGLDNPINLEDALNYAPYTVEELNMEEINIEPIFGLPGGHDNVVHVVDWFSDGEDSRYESN
jgi:hypothetical protein